MVNHAFDSLNDETFCGDYAGATAEAVSGGPLSCPVCMKAMPPRVEKVFQVTDPVNSPDHYRWLPVEAIEITELFNFNLGNALKYIIRADHKGKPIEDLEKARWYLDRELQRRAKQ